MNRIPFVTQYENERITIQNNLSLRFTHNPLIRKFVFIRAGARIISDAFFPEKPLSGISTEIIKKIHTLRFNPSYPYVISAGHFPDIYVRNMGIFFNAFLDPRVTLSEEDWINRQRIVLQTIAIDLEMVKQLGKAYTTIVPLTPDLYTTMDIYTEASDSIFGIVYALSALSDDSFVSNVFPAKKQVAKRKLYTKETAKKLIQQYQPYLEKALLSYKHYAFDEKTRLIKMDVTLASARDGIRRSSAFFDNVVLWASMKLANDLGIHKTSSKELHMWKRTIITAFWDEEEGIFLDDLSDTSRKNKTFCSDFLIVQAAQFLDTDIAEDRDMLLRIVDYIKTHSFDEPFPIKYSKRVDKSRLYWPVRVAAPEYMDETIWSNWGMEYIKLLIRLSTYKNTLLKDAKKHLHRYAVNIETFGGYPELYANDGKIYKTPLYSSLLQNCWIVGYEQATMLYEHAR